MDDLHQLRKMVNPVFNTARTCLEFDAGSGDADSKQLQDALGFESAMDQDTKKVVPPEMMETARRLGPVFSTYVVTRFHGMNRLIASMPDRAIVDLPCGYTSRGIKMSHEGRTYFGFDLPAVIDAMTPAVAKIPGDYEKIHYAAVDATNYESMEAPLSGVTTPLLITTEGLLMYFTQPELEIVFANVLRLLQKHGGSWVVVDRTYFMNEQRIAEALLTDDEKSLAVFKSFSAKGASTFADLKTFNNVIFTGSDEEVKSFIGKMGFEIKEICMADYLPEQIATLKSIPEAEAGLRDVFKTMFFWELRARADKDVKADLNVPFEVQTSFEDSKLAVKIQGRMDTITAPELLSKFQNISGKATEIEVDVEKMTYVSSAGLRVLLIMYKSLEDKSKFKMLNVSDEVKEILEVTGFADFLLA